MALIINTNGMVPSLGGSSESALPSAIEGDALVTNSQGVFESTPVLGIIDGATAHTQGYFAVTTDYYNQAVGQGNTMNMVANTWNDVIPTVYEITDKAVFSQSTVAKYNTATGEYSCEGLESGSFMTAVVNVRIDPEVDESSLEGRLLFTMNSDFGNAQFNIADTVTNMTQGADNFYSARLAIQFFVGDSLTANSDSAGSFKCQLNSSVESLVEVLSITVFANK